VGSLKKTVKNRPPKAMNAPANMASIKAFEVGRLALVTPAASVLASIAAGARQSGVEYSALESAMSITSFLRCGTSIAKAHVPRRMVKTKQARSKRTSDLQITWSDGFVTRYSHKNGLDPKKNQSR